MPRESRKLCKVTSVVLAVVVTSLALFAYLEFASLKKGLLSVLSSRAAAAIGQPVSVADISCRFPFTITIYGITIGNPGGFAPGELLRIKKMTLNMKPRELFSGKFYFKDIAVDSPAVTVMRNKEGKFNISDRMIKSFSGGGPGADYRIDALRIISGVFSLNAGDVMTARRIDVALQNLSSSSKARTAIRGSLVYAGNRIGIRGWAYLKGDPKRFGVTASMNDFSPVLFLKELDRYGVDIGKARVDADIGAAGDTREGVEIRSKVRVRKALVSGAAGDITLSSDSFLDIGDDELIVRNLTLRAGNASEVRLTGVIAGLQKNPTYTADLKIEKFALRALNFIAGAEIAGNLTSGDLKIKGQLKRALPGISGFLFLSGASVKSDAFVADRINSKVIISSLREFSFKAESTANLLAVGKHRFDEAAALRLSLRGRGRPERITISSSALLGPARMTVQGKAINAAAVHLDSGGRLENKSFTGAGELEIKNLRVGARDMGSFVIHSDAELGRGIVELKGLSLRNERVTAKAKAAAVRTASGKSGRRIDINDLTVDYPAESAELTDLSLSLDLRDGEDLSGSFTLSAERISYKDIIGGPLEGGGRFSDKIFEVDFHPMKLFGGNVEFGLSGRTTNGYLPLMVKINAGEIDLADMSGKLSELTKSPYGLSGGTANISFEGALHTMENLTGKASFRLAPFSASRRSDGRSLLKGADLSGTIIFAGKDLQFSADGDVGKVAAHARGDIEDFMSRERKAGISIDVPAVRAADIRDAFWDIFPDALLYAGLDGSLSASLTAVFSGGGLDLDGGVSLRNFILTGENGKYSIGPINGTIPLTYRPAVKYPGGVLPAFDKSRFSRLRRYYESREAADGFSIIHAGSFSYGFKLLDNIEVRVKPEDGLLNIEKVSANIFGGKLEGSAVLGLPGGLKYKGGFIIDGLSLTKLCDSIGPIRGYISGKVDGVAEVNGSGGAISGLIGKADFWSYSTEDEKTLISRKFLKKVGGPAVRSYIGDRPFDKGVMDLYVQKGFLIFRDLDISHTNFLGIRDLSVRVAPFNNRIRIKDLLWSISEAAQRAEKN